MTEANVMFSRRSAVHLTSLSRYIPKARGRMERICSSIKIVIRTRPHITRFVVAGAGSCISSIINERSDTVVAGKRNVFHEGREPRCVAGRGIWGNDRRKRLQGIEKRLRRATVTERAGGSLGDGRRAKSCEGWRWAVKVAVMECSRLQASARRRGAARHGVVIALQASGKGAGRMDTPGSN